MNGPCIVEYDKSKRKWLCISPNGDLAAFPAGKEGKTAAERLVIQYHSAKLNEYIRHLETIQFNEHSLRRAIAGALILSYQNVIEPGPALLKNHPHALAEIIKQNSDTRYYIFKGDQYSLYRCNCTDFSKADEGFRIEPYRYDLKPFGAPHIQGVGLICKHIWAYHFGSLTGTINKRRDTNG